MVLIEDVLLVMVLVGGVRIDIVDDDRVTRTQTDNRDGNDRHGNRDRQTTTQQNADWQ